MAFNGAREGPRNPADISIRQVVKVDAFCRNRLWWQFAGDSTKQSGLET